MSDFNNRNQIDEQFEQCKKMFEKLNAVQCLDGHTKEFLLKLFSFGDNITYEAKSKFVSDNQQHLIDLFEKQTIDPRFTKELYESNVNMKLRSVFKAMEIKTFGDIVKYKDIEEFTRDYEKVFKIVDRKRANGSNLKLSTENALKSFMKENKISWDMSTKLSDKVVAD